MQSLTTLTTCLLLLATFGSVNALNTKQTRPENFRIHSATIKVKVQFDAVQFDSVQFGWVQLKVHNQCTTNRFISHQVYLLLSPFSKDVLSCLNSLLFNTRQGIYEL